MLFKVQYSQANIPVIPTKLAENLDTPTLLDRAS